jgi:uncharacterized protein YdeI (YjbR/CyaY-like superfamily)
MDVRRSRTKNPDQWLATCPEFSRPICEALREFIFRWEPDLTETVNTNMLCYTARKRVFALGAFVKSACVTFFRGSELPDSAGLLNQGEGNHLIRNIALTSLEGLDLAALRALMRAAVKLDAEVDRPPPAPRKREPLPMPPALAKGLKGNKAAAAFFESLKPTYQREYMAWVGFAKLPETQEKRLRETLKALAAGKKWAQRRQEK